MISQVDVPVCDERTANRVVRRINAVRAYAEQVREWAAAETRRAEQQEARLMGWFAPQLLAFAKHRLGDGRRRSIRLPGGTIGLRRQPVRPTVIDEGEVLTWCREHLPEAVQLSVAVAGPAIITLRQWVEQQGGCDAELEVKLRRKVVAEHVKVSGEIPPGMDMAAGDEKLYIN